jgi:CheY-like chemotaxis protein
VLVVNDEPMQLLVLKNLFQQVNFVVTTATNGFEAFNFVKDSLESKILFDLVVLDLNMPVMNGQEACRRIHKMFNEPNQMLINMHEFIVYDFERGKAIVKRYDSDVPFHLLVKYLRPVIVAVSANQPALPLEGFEKQYTTPLLMNEIKQEILELLVERQNLILNQDFSNFVPEEVIKIQSFEVDIEDQKDQINSNIDFYNE